uniref:Uncharacterized protein n=1 Tax=Astyanax mexicanus TaxID=7994 RepID=W5K8K7_ASTMX
RYAFKSGNIPCIIVIIILQVPGGFIQAKVGSSVLLPCEMSPALNAESYEVSWYRPNKEDSLVLLYKDLKVQENTGDPQYRGRATLVGDLQKGYVSLKLENLTVADRGEYVCFVQSVTWYERASVNLDITVVGSPPVLSLAETGDEVNVTCASDGWSPKPTLTWKDMRGRELRNSVVQSWLMFSPSDSEWISCSVGLSDQEMKESRVLPLESAPATEQPSVAIRPMKSSRLVDVVKVKVDKSNVTRITWKLSIKATDRACVLCEERICSGRYYWEITALTEPPPSLCGSYECPSSWYVGVTTETAWNKQHAHLSSENDSWILQYEKEKGYYVNDPVLVPVLVRDRFSRLGVYIDCERHTLSFYDCDKRSHLYTFYNVDSTKPLIPVLSPGNKPRHTVAICEDKCVRCDELYPQQDTKGAGGEM